MKRASKVKAGVLATGLVLSVLLMTGGASAHVAKKNVVIAEFGGAYSQSIGNAFATPFSKQSAYNAQLVDMGDFSSVVQKIEAMVKGHHTQWDMIELLATWENELQVNGVLQKLPAHLRATLKKVLNPGTVTTWGVGIASYTELITCNRDTVGRCPQTAKQFFDTTNFPGRRSLEKDDWLDNCALALEADGVPQTKLFPMDIARCLRKMAQLKNKIAVFWTTADQLQQLFRNKEIDMAVGPDGRMWNLVNGGLNLSLSYKGQLYQTDYFSLLKGAKNTRGALAFIKWYATHPRAQALFATQQVYGVPNPRAYRYIAANVARHLVDFPANKKQTAPVDYNWVRVHGADAAKQWANFLAGG